MKIIVAKLDDINIIMSGTIDNDLIEEKFS